LEPAADGSNAPKPTNPAFKPVDDTAGLPRVLLIGDSISIGYTLPVRKLLQGAANVHRAPENCGATNRGLKQLDKWLGSSRWDVIHFNFGLHDLKYIDAKGNYVPSDKGKQFTPLPDYTRQLQQITERLKATGARIIFATTTPVPEGAKGRIPGDEIAYNRAAVAIMEREKVQVNDLHAWITPEIQSCQPGEVQEKANVHFTARGSAKLAEKVAAAIREQLPANNNP
jgi:acyl-CoA thioesterase-1